MTVLGRANGPAVADGRRYVAYRARDRRHIVTVDTETGRRTRFSVSKHCFSPLAISAGRVVVLCMPGHDQFESYPRFFTRRGALVHTAGIDAYVRRMRTCHRQGCFRASIDIGDAWAKTEWDDSSASGTTWD